MANTSSVAVKGFAATGVGVGGTGVGVGGTGVGVGGTGVGVGGTGVGVGGTGVGVGGTGVGVALGAHPMLRMPISNRPNMMVNILRFLIPSSFAHWGVFT